MNTYSIPNLDKMMTLDTASGARDTFRDRQYVY